MNFWDKTHPLSFAYNQFVDTLLPPVGKSETLQGEAIRAASRIGYDWYNNGWGCNNWSGAVVFLMDHIAPITGKRAVAELEEFRNTLESVKEFSHGEQVSLNDDHIDELVTKLVAFVVQCIIDHPTPIPNEKDMWEFNEPDAVYNEDDDEDDDWF